MFSNACRVLSQCTTWLKVVYLLSRCILELDVYSVIYFNGSNIVSRKWGGSDRGAGARENRGRERCRRRERKGQEAGAQRWRDAGVRCKTLLVAI